MNCAARRATPRGFAEHLATALAFAWLDAYAAAERGEWELLAGKAEAWVSASGTEPAAGQGWSAWIDVARRLI